MTNVIVFLCFKTPFLNTCYVNQDLFLETHTNFVLYVKLYTNIFAVFTFPLRGQTNAIFLYVYRSVISKCLLP